MELNGLVYHSLFHGMLQWMKEGKSGTTLFSVDSKAIVGQYIIM